MRQSAIFDIGLDETLVRNQFPVCMAFAVTAHKCQGLTVDNILISTENIFCDGQAFVAFSRVKSLGGLHLVDFDPSTITCDVVALTEYNRLRQSINLETFTVPSRNRKQTKGRKRKAPPTNLMVGIFTVLKVINLF